MSNTSDFVIENGVLKKYVGPGGDVTIPDGVVVIGPSAFSLCTKITSVTICVGWSILANLLSKSAARCNPSFCLTRSKPSGKARLTIVMR